MRATLAALIAAAAPAFAEPALSYGGGDSAWSNAGTDKTVTRMHTVTKTVCPVVPETCEASGILTSAVETATATASGSASGSVTGTGSGAGTGAVAGTGSGSGSGSETGSETGSTRISTIVTFTWGGVWTSTQTVDTTRALETSLATGPGMKYTPSESSPNSPQSTEVVTDTQSVFTTVSPVTETQTHGGSTTLVSHMTTSTGTSSFKTTLTSALTSSPSAPKSTEIVTDTTSIYTTICPVTETQSHGGSTTLVSYTTTSTGTTTFQTTVTSPVSPKSTEIVTDTTSLFTTVCPVTETQSHGGSTTLVSFTTTSTGTTTFQTTVTSPVLPKSTEIVTDTTSLFTTVCPVTETQTTSGSTTVSTYTTTSTGTSTFQTTITTGGSGGGSSPSTSTWTSTFGTTETYTSGTETTVVTTSLTSSGTTTISTSVGPSSHGNGTTSLGPIGTGSTKPTGTGPTRPIGTSPSGTGPAGTASGTASGTISHKSSTSTCHKPTATAKKCIPCEGQPDSDPANHCGLDIHTNYYDEAPKTCRTVHYDFTITNQTISPDGIPRMGLVINGQMPGPLIEANWGDTVVVNVVNNLPDAGNNGTTIHWHGIRQNWTTAEDGVPSIVQCPIAPGHSQTYEWVANSYGTSWYHSHWAIQTYEGVFGPMIIHGPAAAAYDDEQMIVLQDWSHSTVDELYNYAQNVDVSNRTNPVLDTGLINGKNIWGEDGAANATGERFKMSVTKGKSYRLRLVNTGIAATFVFYVDQHEFTVIANDFVPIKPYTTNKITINVGQRYDVILKADQAVGNYWMRSDNQQPCSPVIAADNIKAIIHYDGADDSVPTSQAYGYAPTCADEDTKNLVPIVPWSAGSNSQEVDETVLIGANGGNPNLYKWTLSGTTFQSQWGDPTLLSIVENGTVPDYSGRLAIEAPKLGEWVYVVIDSPIPVPHPIHLHGHDFLVLAQGSGLYHSGIPLNLENPTRRDVANMNGDPVNGQGSYLVVAFYTNNPGVWLMHCHIGWHVAMGFALQIIEAKDQIADTVTDTCKIKDTCAAWDAYAVENGIVVNDSGV